MVQEEERATAASCTSWQTHAGELSPQKRARELRLLRRAACTAESAGQSKPWTETRKGRLKPNSRKSEAEGIKEEAGERKSEELPVSGPPASDE